MFGFFMVLILTVVVRGIDDGGKGGYEGLGKGTTVTLVPHGMKGPIMYRKRRGECE